MGALGWIAAGLYLLIGAGVLLANARPRAQARAVEKFALNVGLSLPELLAEPIRRRMLSKRRSSIVGGMIGTAASAIAFLISPASSPEGALSPLIIVAGLLAGFAIGTSVSAFRNAARQVSDDQVRYARAQAVSITDYASQAELWLARLPVGLAVVAVLVIATLAQFGLVHYTGAAAIVGSIAVALVATCTLVVFELVGRQVVAMGNNVESPEDLVWEDAVRAMTIRELAGAPTFLGYYALLMVASPLLVSPDDGFRTGLALVYLGLAVITLIVAIGMLVSALVVKRHFLRRLWPELVVEASA